MSPIPVVPVFRVGYQDVMKRRVLGLASAQQQCAEKQKAFRSASYNQHEPNLARIAGGHKEVTADARTNGTDKIGLSA